MKYNLVKVQQCNKCSENATTLYVMQEQNTLCARCTLGYFSFYFSRQSMKEVKFYLTDIILDHVNKKQKSKIYEWNSINELVSFEMKNESEQLYERKKNTQSFNLFLIANEIATALECTELLKQRICSNCMKFRFHLIRVPCCKTLFCVTCLTSFKIKKRKCTICYEDLYRNHQELNELLTNLCLTAWQIADWEVEPRKKQLKQAIEKPLIPKCDQEKANYLQIKFATIIAFMDEAKFPWVKILEQEQTELLESCKAPGDIAKTIQNSISVLFQMAILPHTSHTLVRNGFWVSLNLIISVFAVKIKNNLVPTTTKKYENVNQITDEFTKSCISFFNFMIGWFILQNRYFAQDLSSVIYFSLFSIPLAFFITNFIKSFLISYFEKKAKFDFY